MKAALFLLVFAAMSARAANVLYFRDAPIGADRMAEALAAGGHSVTVATGAADFKTRIESGAHEVGVFFVQKRAASESAAAIQSLSAFVAAGGRALYADWSENAALAAGFGAGFTGRANARSVTQIVLNPATTPVPEPVALRPTGWFRSTVGLTALAGSSVAALFENGDAAIVRDATGRSLTFGFLNDTPETAAVFRRGVEFVLANLPLEPFSGQFSQLLTGPGGVAGRIELTLGSGGAFTGRLLFRDLNEVLMGAFGADGIFRGTAANLTITLTLRFAGAEPRLAGAVTDGATTWTSDSATVRAGAEPPQFGRKGRYTFVVPDSRQAGLPRGDAWAVFAGDTSGRLRFAGRFADGVKFSGDGAVQPDGSVPLYLVANPPAESLGGSLRFSDARGTNLTGDFTWTRFAAANGFAVTTPIAGGRFIPPAAGQRMFTFQNAAAKIAKAKLSADLPGFPKKVIFNVRASGLEAAPPNPNGLALQFSAATGKVTGSFEHRTLGRCKVTGVLVQPANAVRGNFAGGGSSGIFLLAPRYLHWCLIASRFGSAMTAFPKMTATKPILKAVLRRAGAIVVSTLVFSHAPCAAAEDRRAEAGAAFFEKGAFESAVAEWKSASEAHRKKGETPALIDTLAQLASAYHALGQHRLAGKALDEAAALARETNDRARLVSSLSSLGAINTFSRDAADAEKTLREALALARQEGDPAALGSVLNNLGNLLAAQERFGEGRAAYREAIDHMGVGASGAKARANLARIAVASGDFKHAPALNAAAIKAAQSLPDSHDKAFALLRAGQTWEELFEKAPAHEQRRRVDALRAYGQAARAAEAVGDDRSLSFALGYTGRLYEREKKFAEAMRLTNRALFLAQKIQSPDVLYQWEWQLGRILREQGRRDDAIAACQRAVDLLKNIRTDLSTRLGNSNARSSFRERAGGVYFDLADLLLQRADDLRDETALRDCLIQARDICEQLKTVELEDYFQDDCVNLFKKKRETIEDILQAKGATKEKDKDGRNAALEKATRTTAVVYIIPLRDRTETLLSLPGGLRRVKSRVTVAQITDTVRAFREHLEKRTTSEYLAESWQLYDWLIRPLETLLEQNKIDTLVFVPDGALRTIPMAALNDRQNFLIEKYSIAITPGLTLMEPRPIARTNMTVMASGLSDSVQGYQALPFVVAEMNKLKELFNPDIIMNRDFAPERLVKDFAARPYSIVHIASHGEFSSDVKKTFVLTYNSRFTLDALEKLLSPTQLRDQPVEMLALSACQTAAGDDRAALGLGGIAVKAGARSAFATLWNVNDQASTTLVGEFYTTLRDRPQMSKAQALRKAQMTLLKDERFSHPCLWAPYLIIGNWL